MKTNEYSNNIKINNLPNKRKNFTFLSFVVCYASALSGFAAETHAVPDKPFSAADYYWSGTQSRFAWVENWSSTQAVWEQTPVTDLGDVSTKVFGAMNNKTGLNMVSVEGNLTIKGILYDVMTPDTYYPYPSQPMVWYDNLESTTFTVTNGIVNTSEFFAYIYDANIYDKVSLCIRGRKGSKDFTVNLGGVYGENGSKTKLGTSNTGEFITNLNITNDIVLTSAMESAPTMLEICAKNFTMTSGKSIYLENSNLIFLKGTDKENEVWSDPVLDLSENQIFVQGTNKITSGGSYKDFTLTLGSIYGASGSRTSLGTSEEFITNLNITNDITLFAENGSASVLEIYAKNFSMASGKNIYLENSRISFLKGADKEDDVWTNPSLDLSGNTVYAKGRSYIVLGNVYNNAYDSTIVLGDVHISSAQTSNTFISMYTDNTVSARIGKIFASASTAGVSGGALSFYTNGRLLNVESIDVALASIDIRAKLTVEGDFTNSYLGADYAQISEVRLRDGTPSLTISGALVNNGRILFDKDAVANVEVRIGGISGGVDETTRITTGSSQMTTLILTGDGDYSYKGRIHDIPQAQALSKDSIEEKGFVGAISIVKEGVGTQRLTGDNYYRGDTTVKAGELFINASTIKGVDRGEIWGLGSVILEGGRFGAIGTDSEIGKIFATNIKFAGGALVFDIESAKSFDTIALSGEEPITLANGSVVKIEVNFLSFNEEILFTPYELIDFGGNIVDAALLLNYELVFGESAHASSFEGALSIMENKLVLIVSGAVIPEPSAYATAFGILAFALAMLRKRKQ